MSDAGLRQQVARLERELAELRRTIESAERHVPDDGSGDDARSEGVSRRHLLRLAGVTTAAGVAGAVLAASPASAGVDGDVVLGGPNDAVGANTSITSTNSGKTLTINNTASSGNGIAIEATGSSQSTSRGISATGAVGVVGSSFDNGGQGLYGITTGTGASTIAVRAEPTGSGSVGVAITNAGSNTLGILADGGRAPIQLMPNFTSGAPSSGTHGAGELVVDSSNDLFYCLTTGTPGVWTKLNNQAGPGGGPQLVSPPQRVYDSRPAQPNPGANPQGPLAFNATRTINCSPSVPSGATAIIFNLTVVNTVGSNGALALFSASSAAPLTSNINWTTAGTVLANQAISACDASQDVKVKCVARAGCSTNFILDVFGYYL